MRGRHYFVLLAFLTGCRDVATDGEHSMGKSNVSKTLLEDSSKREKRSNDTVAYDYKFERVNDSTKLYLLIKNGALDKKLNVPKSLLFKISIESKISNSIPITKEGTAVLKSSNESFSDSPNSSEGDYFAADYVFTEGKCSLKIRVDIENFAACAVTTNCVELDSYFEKYPNYGTFKRIWKRKE